MKLFESFNQIDDALLGGAVSIGNFDGVHRGHAHIIQRLRDKASSVGGPSIVFTFDPHPVRLLRPEKAPPPLTWTKRKAKLLGELGVDVLIAYPTDQSLLELTAAEFFDKVLVQSLCAKAVVEGPNFFFGRKRSGDVKMLTQLCQSNQIECDIVDPTLRDDELISSSRIRALLGNGSVADAAALLGRPYRLRGMVTHGARRGAALGFPTANLEAIDTLIPAKGVYAGRAVYKGTTFGAAIHIGPNPTFGEDASKVEVHLLDFAQTIYGDPLKVDFLAKLRDIQPFPNPIALQEQLTKDIEAAEVVFCSADMT